MSAPRVGIPYAPGRFFTGWGYAVECPSCGHLSFGKGTTEDAVTKSAARLHGEHRTLEHEEES